MYDFLKDAKNIAVVGLSQNPERSSYGVAQYLQRHFRVIPINPMISEWNGLTSYPDITSASKDFSIDVVNVFRKPSELAQVIDECIALKIPHLWLQLGVVNEGEKARAEAHGCSVIMDECIAVIDRRLRG